MSLQLEAMDAIKKLAALGLTPEQAKTGLERVYVQRAKNAGATIEPYSLRVPGFGHQPAGWIADGNGVRCNNISEYAVAKEWLELSA